MNDGTLTVKTTKGNIKVIPCEDESFPGISVYCNGELITMIEYAEDRDTFRTIAYDRKKDEPVAIVNF